MVSNGLSKRRGPLRRPKVCKASPNPGRCHPTVTCSIVPDAWSQPVEGGSPATLMHCNTDLVIGEVVDVECWATAGDFQPSGPQNNCKPGGSEYLSGPAGTHQLFAKTTWSDGATCTAQATVTVTDP